MDRPPENERMARFETLLEGVAKDIKEIKDSQSQQIRDIKAEKMDRTEFNLINSEYLRNITDLQQKCKEHEDQIDTQNTQLTIMSTQWKVWGIVGGIALTIIQLAVTVFVK